MAEIFLSASITLLFEKLLSPELINFARREGVHTAVKKWTIMLLKIQAVLGDAEEKQITNPIVKIWLNELRDLAYDVEDILDEFNTETLRQKIKAESFQAAKSTSSKVRSLIPTCCPNFKPSAVIFNYKMESKIKGITTRLQEIVTQKGDLDLKENGGGSFNNRTREKPINIPTSSLPESHVYGREKDKEAILELLIGSEARDADEVFCVIPVIGMGGVGKTTLARLVYNDDRVKGYFDLKGWVCVSEEFDLIRVTKAMLESFTKQNSDANDLDRLQVSLKDEVSKRKFLLVLDDVWLENYENWTILRRPLEAGAAGSKIIVTTRNEGVSSIMGTLLGHPLKTLSNDDCRSIFTQHALGARDFESRPHLRQAGEEIVKRCNGLPLAAKALGGLLRTKVDLDDWEDVLNSTLWDLPEEKCGIIPALRLSYLHLPPHLKQCFTYCAILPKDYEFKEELLVLLWMAAGLVQNGSNKKQMEDVGCGYFHDLLSRSFFQVSGSSKTTFVMHDLINDLAQWVAGETFFRLEGKGQCKISKKARHSSYVASCCDGIKKFEVFNEVECLRTFLPLMTPPKSFLTYNVPLDVLPKLRCLRVLSLCGYRITELPNSIGDLIHLRYLDLSSTKLFSLPESISALCNLQMLILKDCSCLKKLPTTMGNLINLRLLDITNSDSIEDMPSGIGKLTSLQNLSNFIVGNNSGSGIRELMKLNNLRGMLCISMLKNVINAQDARDANLKEKHGLDALIIEWSFEFTDSRIEDVEEVLDMLQPCKKLKELTIKRYGGVRFPMWIGDSSFSVMVLLQLENCESCTSLPPLGQLPSLKYLCIMGMNKVNSVGLEFYGEDCPKPFPSLEILNFVDMQEWMDWFASGNDRQREAFPCLRELSIEKCPKFLGKLPDHLSSLEKLIINGCQQLVVSISSLPKLCKLDIQKCQELVYSSTVCLKSLKSMDLSNISSLMCLTETFLQGLTQVKDLQIAGSSELTSLWQKKAGLLEHLSSLHRLKISGCPKFVSLAAEVEPKHSGVPCRLESLELYLCDNLEQVHGLHSLTFLRKLTIEGCPRLVSLPETGLPSMLRELIIRNCSGLKYLPWARMHCSKYLSLEYLCIERSDSLTSIFMGKLPSSLKKLEIECCKNLQSLVKEEESSTTTTAVTSLRNESNDNALLDSLRIRWCPSLRFISSRGKLPTILKYLYVHACPKLELIAEGLHNNTSLESIEVFHCESLKSLPEGLHNLGHLSSICLADCPSLVFPDGGLSATNLGRLSIENCEKLEALPHHMHNLTSLQHLNLDNCPGIVSFPEEGFPTNLTSLEIRYLKICKPLFEWGLHRLTSLRHLEVWGGCPDLVSFPMEEGMNMILLPTSLTHLTIKEFPNLECLSSKGFQNLTSLEYLEISSCPKLKSFPEEGLPCSLLELYIDGCPLLKQHCKRNHGRDWPKIAHIPCVHIDYRFIFGPQDLRNEFV